MLKIDKDLHEKIRNTIMSLMMIYQNKKHIIVMSADYFESECFTPVFMLFHHMKDRSEKKVAQVLNTVLYELIDEGKLIIDDKYNIYLPEYLEYSLVHDKTDGSIS